MNDWITTKQQTRQEWSQFLNCAGEILDAAMKADNAARGNIQLFYPALKIVVHRGFFDLSF